MSLYHTSIYLAGPLRFERNKALFGGAIFGAAIGDSCRDGMSVYAQRHCQQSMNE